MIIDNQDLKDLYYMEGETLKFIIYEPDESGNLMLVFDKHTIDISCDGIIIVERRDTKAGERRIRDHEKGCVK